MTDDLPAWYPLANATDAQIDSWLTAENLPYAEMRDALPWRHKPYHFDAWTVGLHEARNAIGDGTTISDILPGISLISLPPRRAAGRIEQ